MPLKHKEARTEITVRKHSKVRPSVLWIHEGYFCVSAEYACAVLCCELLELTLSSAAIQEVWWCRSVLGCSSERKQFSVPMFDIFSAFQQGGIS